LKAITELKNFYGAGTTQKTSLKNKNRDIMLGVKSHYAASLFLATN